MKPADDQTIALSRRNRNGVFDVWTVDEVLDRDWSCQACDLQFKAKDFKRMYDCCPKCLGTDLERFSRWKVRNNHAIDTRCKICRHTFNQASYNGFIKRRCPGCNSEKVLWMVPDWW